MTIECVGRPILAGFARVGFFSCLFSRSHLINARTSRKRGNLRRETVQTQPNHHFPLVSVVRVLWFFCHKTIYEITSRYLLLRRAVPYHLPLLIFPFGPEKTSGL